MTEPRKPIVMSAEAFRAWQNGYRDSDAPESEEDIRVDVGLGIAVRAGDMPTDDGWGGF